METFVTDNAPKPDRPERRSAHRHRVLKGAVLTFNSLGAFEGVVRNQSERGAMLALGDTAGVPASFDLAISLDETTRPAQVRWRSMNAVGVEFA
jgi:PilZ domain-containing protein